MAKSLLLIEHKDGRRYAVPEKVFRERYEPEGFKAVRYEDGTAYEAPKAERKKD